MNMDKKRYLTQNIFISVLLTNVSNVCMAETEQHPTAIQSNKFADALVTLSEYLISKQAIISEESFGGYGGLTNDLKFYKETKNIDRTNKQIISIVRWETKHPNNLHDIIVNIYDDKDRLIRDYSASYLPVHRGAPYQTLINFHYYGKNLTSFRQFDVYDDIQYEWCDGKYNDKPVSISFDFDEIPDTANDIKNDELRLAYFACFKNPATAKPYTDPLSEIR